MQKKPSLYPLKFFPIFKEKVWGGNKLKTLLHKNTENYTGESWELSAVEENVSICSNGKLRGKSLTDILETYQENVLGERIFNAYGTDFPLLFKFIDAKEDLSVQLHPNDILAKERHNVSGKTEMWYIMQADKGAGLILGFNKQMDESIYIKALENNKITEVLHNEPVNKEDSFFIAAGTVHAIGAGVLLAEIQQTSDITYRIYDWDRPDIDGKMRQLHTDLALRALNYKMPNAKLAYKDVENEIVNLCNSTYFVTNKLNLTQNFKREFLEMDSFVVYMCVEGNAIIESTNHSEEIQKGETILIPACIPQIYINTNSAVLLEVYIP